MFKKESKIYNLIFCDDLIPLVMV